MILNALKRSQDKHFLFRFVVRIYQRNDFSVSDIQMYPKKYQLYVRYVTLIIDQFLMTFFPKSCTAMNRIADEGTKTRSAI